MSDAGGAGRQALSKSNTIINTHLILQPDGDEPVKRLPRDEGCCRRGKPGEDGEQTPHGASLSRHACPRPTRRQARLRVSERDGDKTNTFRCQDSPGCATPGIVSGCTAGPGSPRTLPSISERGIHSIELKGLFANYSRCSSDDGHAWRTSIALALSGNQAF